MNNRKQVPSMNVFHLFVIEQLYSLTRGDVPFDDYAFRQLSEEFILLYNDYKNEMKVNR